MKSHAEGYVALGLVLAIGLGWYLIQPLPVREALHDAESDAVSDAVSPAEVSGESRTSIKSITTAPFIESNDAAPSAVLPRILIVDEAGYPVAGAKIKVAKEAPSGANTPTQSISWVWAMFGSKLKEEITLGGAATEVMSDALGQVTWPVKHPGSWYLIAEKGALRAQAKILAEAPDREWLKWNFQSGEPRVLRITLSKYRDIRVKVVDELGAPVHGAIVVVLDPDKNRPVWNEGRDHSAHLFDSAITGRDGLIRWRAFATDEHSLAACARIRFYVLRYGDSIIKTDRTWDGDSNPIVITAPGLVKTHVSVAAKDQRATKPNRDLVWQIGKPPQEDHGFISGQPLRQFAEVAEWRLKSWAQNIPLNGCVLSCFVRGASVGYWLRSSSETSRTGVWVVPSEPSAQWVIEAGDAMATLRFHVRGADSTPSTLNGYYIVNQDGERKYVAPSRDGTCQLEVAPNSSGTLYVVKEGKNARTIPFARNAKPTNTVKTLNFGALAPGQVHDLDDVVLPQHSIAPFGVVIDGRGCVVKGATVSLYRPGSPSPSVPIASTYSDQNGKFTFDEQLLTSPFLLVRATTERARCQVSLYRQSQELILALDQGGHIAGSVRYTDAIRPQLCLELQGSDPITLGSLSVDAHGFFQSRRHPPGTYSLVVTVAGVEAVRFDALRIEPGQKRRPPQLQDLALGQDFEWCTVKVLDCRGLPLRHAKVTPLYRSGFPGLSRAGTFESNGLGLAKVLVRRDRQLRIHVSPPAPGYGRRNEPAPQSVVNPTFPLTVRLSPYPQVSLRFSPPVPTPPESKLLVFLSRRRSHSELAELRKRELKRAKRLNRRRPAYVSPFANDGGCMGLIQAGNRGQTFSSRRTAEGRYVLRILPKGANAQDADIRALILQDVFVGRASAELRIQLTPGQMARLREGL